MDVGIVLSGGGAKGAFEVGALSVLLPWLKRSGHILKAISGTSIGAFNGAFVASGQFNELEQIWRAFDSGKNPFTKPAFINPLLSVLTHGYAYETPRTYIESAINAEKLLFSNVRYINTMVRAGDGLLRVGGNIENKSIGTLRAEILASMAIMPVTPMVEVDGHMYVDGGFRDTVPIKALIENAGCKLDMVYVIAVNPRERFWDSSMANKNASLMDRLNFAFNDILWDEAHRNDIAEGERRLKSKCSVVYPHYSYGSGANFSQQQIRDFIAHGSDVMGRVLGFSKE